jgi:hypothetical protein
MAIGVTNLGELLCTTTIVALSHLATRLFEASNKGTVGYEPSLGGWQTRKAVV